MSALIMSAFSSTPKTVCCKVRLDQCSVDYRPILRPKYIISLCHQRTNEPTY